MLGAGLEQSLAIKSAKQLGMRVIACDANSNAPGFEYADVSHCLKLQDITQLIAIAKEENIDGVFSHGVEIPEIVAKLTDALGLPGITLEVAELCLNKHQRLSRLQDRGVRCPDFSVYYSFDELLAQLETTALPVIVKPTRLSGARGVILITGLDDIEILKVAYKTFGSAYTFIVEEVLSGLQLSTESVVHDGQIITFAIADRNYEHSSELYPHLIEDGINFPSTISDRLRQEVLNVVEDAIKCLGINSGAAKGDLIIHNGKPYVIEMAARTSGGWFSAGSIKYATGIDNLTPLLEMAVGEKPNLSLLKPKYNKFCAQRYWISRETGTFQGMKDLNNSEDMDGVVMFEKFFPNTGTKMKKAESHSDRFAQVIVVGNNIDEVKLSAKNVIRNLKVELKK